MKVIFSSHSNLLLRFEDLNMMVTILQKNSINRLLGLSFRSFIKVKKWSTSHYRDLMKIILQNTMYIHTCVSERV